jgi:hypothetical protein
LATCPGECWRLIGVPPYEAHTLAIMASPTTCAVPGCGRPARYEFTSGGQRRDARCRWHGLVYPPLCGRAIRVALLVGTILLVINQGDVVLSGQLTALVVAKIGLTYLVPLLVSAYSALAANRLRER